ncbi:hypothetical protein CPB84DRAFT_1848630 [Gymnopilus junonius]|uniref:Protein kinase domain-containing protein n=1 Tax=Gymnopilus junonius TaxID=109634 RepID=A0A9P5NHR7_GYMJU|nr:hypothetical protein CPB84DRAFT_1848630 [Gymnopilus junonius]
MRLPYLEKNPLHTNSTATRKPQFYDRHIAEDLRLKKMAFLDKTFFEILSKICDQYVKQLSKYKQSKYILSSYRGIRLPSQDNIFDETSLVAYCQWIPVLDVSTEAEEAASADAAADSYLFTRWSLRRFLSSEDKPGFDLVRKYDLQIPINWEYKNLGFGSEIFSALRTQGGDFHWTTCQERSGRHDATSRCRNHNHRTEGRLTVTGRPTGPDSQSTVKIINSSTVSTVPDDEGRSSKRLRKDTNSAAERKVQFILQQAWTSAVVRDASFIIISTGNEECIAIRHRETQRLLISPPIRPSDKTGLAYVKVCVGLFIVAYQDAVDRARQLDSDHLSPYAQALLRLRIDNRPALPNASASGLFERHPVSSKILPLESYFLQLLTQSRRFDLRLHGRELATTQYNRNTWTFTRHGSGNMTANSSGSAHMNGDIVFLDIDRLFNKTSRVWKVYFGVTSAADNRTDYFPRPLVLKLARDANEVADLKTEYEWYGRLNDAGVTSILKCYGMFSCQVNAHEEQYCLLLEDGGVPISNRLGMTRLVHTSKHSNLYEEAVMDVHKNNFAHKRIKEDHMLMDVNRGKATLISLKSCTQLNEAVAASLRATDIIATGLCLGLLSQGGSHTTNPARSSGIGESGHSQVPSGFFGVVD